MFQAIYDALTEARDVLAALDGHTVRTAGHTGPCHVSATIAKLDTAIRLLASWRRQTGK